MKRSATMSSNLAGPGLQKLNSIYSVVEGVVQATPTPMLDLALFLYSILTPEPASTPFLPEPGSIHLRDLALYKPSVYHSLDVDNITSSSTVMPSSASSTDQLEYGATEVARTGSCLCKRVRYEISGDPLAFRICHCVNCRKATGSAFMANAFFLGKNLNIVTGRNDLRSYEDAETASGSPIKRWFCASCGSNVYMEPTNPKAATLVVLQSGGIDGDAVSEWVPDGEWFTEQKRKWVECAIKPSSRRTKSKL
ncbi:hypothetical protein NMY22_g1044 [Coprinellus aureogranulatus]|nr:hypothetical protein NMY22_g1044 [Coprinellus aureogranulatus]